GQGRPAARGAGARPRGPRHAGRRGRRRGPDDRARAATGGGHPEPRPDRPRAGAGARTAGRTGQGALAVGPGGRLLSDGHGERVGLSGERGVDPARPGYVRPVQRPSGPVGSEL
ncbi:MAG: hypothetical protein AVDCRST_MAG41-1213, partial [uncultured Corynebacteriales bacterium]